MSGSLEDILQNLKRKGVYGSAVIDKDGGLVSSDLPTEVHEETFSIMCATIMGASNSANSELDRKPARRIIIDSKEGRIIIARTQEGLLLAVIVGAEQKLGRLFDEITRAAEQIKEEV